MHSVPKKMFNKLFFFAKRVRKSNLQKVVQAFLDRWSWFDAFQVHYFLACKWQLIAEHSRTFCFHQVCALKDELYLLRHTPVGGMGIIVGINEQHKSAESLFRAALILQLAQFLCFELIAFAAPCLADHVILDKK